MPPIQYIGLNGDKENQELKEMVNSFYNKINKRINEVFYFVVHVKKHNKNMTNVNLRIKSRNKLFFAHESSHGKTGKIMQSALRKLESEINHKKYA